MQVRKHFECVLSLLCLCLWFTFEARGAEPEKAKKDSVISLIDRFSFRTNALEWLLTVPNVGVEFDLSPSVYNKMTIGLNAKLNWNTYHSIAPATVFNLFEIRPEYRYYWRTVSREPRDKSVKRSFGQWLREDVFTRERVNAKPWRAWYLGAYTHAGTYNIKLGETGRRGSFCGLGVSFGYGLPLYSYNKGAVDIEFGMSLGMLMTQYVAYGHNPVGYYYYEKAALSKDFRVLPYPVLSELRVAFVYRTRSIQDKYDKTDPELLARKLDRQDKRTQQQEEKKLEKERKAQEKEALKAEKKAGKKKKEVEE